MIVSYNNNSSQHHHQRQLHSRSVEILDRCRRFCRMWLVTAMRVCDGWTRERWAKARPNDPAGRRRLQTLTTTMWAISGLAVVVWLLTATSASARYPVVLGESWPVCHRWPSQWLCVSICPMTVRTALTTVPVLGSPQSLHRLFWCFVSLLCCANNSSSQFAIYVIWFLRHQIKNCFMAFQMSLKKV